MIRGGWDFRLLAAAAAMLAAAAYGQFAGLAGLSFDFFELQDRYVLLGAAVLLVGASRLHPRVADYAVQIELKLVMAAAAALAILLWAGTYWLMRDFPLTRDEHMVVFDSIIFRDGAMAAPLAPSWRPYLTVLVPAFTLGMQGNIAWVSSYMPVNAAMRALFGLVADPALMNPVLAGAGLVALWRVARRIWPDDQKAQAVALLIYLTSAQMLVNAMTTYAMTGHMAFNLVWLALFLRRDAIGHAGALSVGFLAVGLHQIIFHPLFALPFVLQLVTERRWKLVGFYGLGYAAIGLFWISYPHMVMESVGATPADGVGADSTTFLQDRVLPLLLHPIWGGGSLMILNLARFVSWQNLALLPLLIASIAAVRRNEGIAQPLMLAFIATPVAMYVLLPFQGHGWGYRYVHGLLGPAALLAGYGWRQIVREGAEDRARALLALGTGATVLIAIPFLLYTTAMFVRPYADVDAMIARIGADMVVIDTEEIAFAIDSVRNVPDLSNRPMRLASAPSTPTDIDRLCARGTIAFVDRATMQELGLGTAHQAKSPRFERLQATIAGKRCDAGNAGQPSFR